MRLSLTLNNKPEGFTDLESPEVREVRGYVDMVLGQLEKPDYSIDGGALILDLKEFGESVRKAILGILKSTMLSSMQITVNEVQ